MYSSDISVIVLRLHYNYYRIVTVLEALGTVHVLRSKFWPQILYHIYYTNIVCYYYKTIYHPISNRNQLLSCILLIFRAECDNISGSKDGTCADGFGVCCIGKYMFLPYHITNHLRILKIISEPSNKLNYILYWNHYAF